MAFAVAGLLLSAGTAARPLSARAPIFGARTHAWRFEPATANDNRIAAGTVTNRVLTLALELRPSLWRPNGDSGVAIAVPAFAEAGKAASIPGPLLRVVAGTELRVSLRNLLDVRAVVRGLRDHDGTVDSLVLAPGESHDVRFTARAIGTHFSRPAAASGCS
jgi:FtsP/CotA-like multicopper oxidase with cupredoxin domain